MMTNAVIAPAMLLAVLGLALAFHDVKRIVVGVLVALGLMACAIVFTGRVDMLIVMTGCWLSLMATTALIYWPHGKLATPAALILASANAGVWAGLVTAAEGAVGSVPAIVAPMLVVVPAYLCVRRGWTIAPRVLASWLLAVAVLAASLPFLVEHPGYVPDHKM